jgi:predicted NBD/HSP70 family sugar kinase
MSPTFDPAPLKGSNSGQLRHFNERVVLDVVRRLEVASKADISRATGLTPPTIATIVDSLEAAGYLAQKGRKFGGKGQPSVMYELAPDGAFSIGIHIGRRAIDAVLTGFAGQRLIEQTHEYDYPQPDEVRKLGESIIKKFKSKLGKRIHRAVGIGIAAPYFLGGWGEELEFTAEISAQWRSLDLRTFFHQPKDALPVFTENDASAAAVAELVYGTGKTCRDFIHLSINTLIGGGVVLDGTLQSGPNGNAGAYGPLPVTKSKLSTVRPSAAPFEILLKRASVYILMRHLRENGVTINRARDVLDLSAKDKALVNEWQDDCADALAQAIIASIAVIDVDVIVVDGILPEPVLIDTVERIRTRFADFLPAGLVAPEIVTGRFGSWAAPVGASILPLHAMFGPDRGVLTKMATERKPLMIGAAT